MDTRSVFSSNDIKPNLRPLVRSCSCVAPSMVYWLTIPEFANEVESLLERGVHVSDEVVLPIMRRVYSQKLEEFAKSGKSKKEFGFSFKSAEKAIKSIEFAVEKAQR